MTDREEREEHIKRLEAVLACEEKQCSGECSKQACDDNCALLYDQGNWGEWKETLRYAIDSLKTDLKYDLLYEETSGQVDKPTTKNDVPDNNVGKIDLITGNDCETCIHNKGVLECDMYGCKYESTTKNVLAQERYQDLIEYFGDEKVAKTILESRTEFKAWLERLRWNGKKVDELARELEQLKPTAKNDLAVDAVSRKAVLNKILKFRVTDGRSVSVTGLWTEVNDLPSVTTQEPKWIPCSEKLPEYGEEVLTCSNGGFIEIQILESGCDGYWENRNGDWSDLDEITAWMPLPRHIVR